ASNEYRHSKWLSMMERRLKLAKELLNPRDSVLIVTIDEHEYLHLGCLLEEIFRGARIQMVTIVINPNGVARDREMYRVDEYAFFVYLGNAAPVMLEDPLFTSEVNQLKAAQVRGEVANGNHSRRTSVRWERLLRGGNNSDRRRSPNCFYPVYIDPNTRKIIEVGEALSPSQSCNEISDKDGLIKIFPIAEGTGAEKTWQMTAANLRKLVAEGYARVGEYNRRLDRWSLLYLGKKQRERIALGQIRVTGRDDNGVVLVEEATAQIIKRFPKTVWNRQSHSAGEYGSRLIRAILPERIFPFPKSLYAVRDTLKTVLDEKPDALIVDFFAGSGTTLHAVNLLNAEDGGNRRCILVTNNEVSDAEEKVLRRAGHTPADDEWQRLGVAQYVT
ncbi:MAG: site-specific DNA-methyltransferase, partial [Selenomonadaceae bacterium]|nr:site-specific DNA-methyltransferase [Selenomonadaceae bacterium]